MKKKVVYRGRAKHYFNWVFCHPHREHREEAAAEVIEPQHSLSYFFLLAQPRL